MNSPRPTQTAIASLKDSIREECRLAAIGADKRTPEQEARFQLLFTANSIAAKAAEAERDQTEET